MDVAYRYKNGRSFGVPAQVAGQRLDAIRLTNEGRLTPSDVVNDAADPDSPLHNVFDWDDASAARSHREHRARQLIAAVVEVRVKFVGNRPQTTEQIAFVSIGEPRPGGACYVAAVEAMEDPDMRDKVLRDAILGLQAWRRRYGHLAELAELVAAIDQAEAVAV